MASADPATAPRGVVTRHRRVLRVLAAVAILALLVYGGYEFAPTLAEARQSLTHPNWAWVAVAGWAQLVAIAHLARLQRSMLRTGGIRIGLRRALGLAFTSNAMSITLPGGMLFSSVYSFRRMRTWGASSPLVAFELIVSGLLSGLTFVVIAVLGATFAGTNPSLWTLLLELAAAITAVLGLRYLIRRPGLLARIAGAVLARVNRLRRRPAGSGDEQLARLLDELTHIRPRGRDWLLSTLFAAVNWMADVLCLLACLRAVDLDDASLAVAMVAYAAGIAASNVPLVPGGLGVVDAALIFALVESGQGAGPAAAAVVLYRFFSLVLVALIGWIIWAAVRRVESREAAAPAG